jgi:hypothetical protein
MANVKKAAPATNKTALIWEINLPSAEQANKSIWLPLSYMITGS